MEYILLLHDDESRWAKMAEAERDREMGAYMAYRKALHEAGVLTGGNRLESATTSTRVRVTGDGKRSVLDGPYAEAKEQLGGYFTIDVPDLDSAITWAARCPCANSGTVEVRPVGAVPALT